MTWEIRRTSADDWRDVRDVRLRALKDAPTAFGSTYERELAFTEDQWRQRATQMSFLAYDVDRSIPVGVVAGIPWGDGDVLLVAMWIDPECRGATLGEALVDAVADAARGEGAAQVVLHVTESNTAARKLYERCGFDYTGEREPLDSHPDLDVILMAMPLTAPESQRAQRRRTLR